MERAHIEQLIADALEGTSLFLIDLKIGSANDIHVQIDGDEGVSIQDCVKVSRGIEHNLDREEEDFSLQVTSPGADKPLKVWRQHRRHVGRKLELLTTDDRKVTGTLLEVNDDKLQLQTDARREKQEGKTVKIEPQELTFSKDEIKESKVVISFK
ncbi:MAG: ribosome assembly cofactor RimP [Cryomorphaceae bacterium]|nr:MAG: ribosome assembly cofactor RimP [Cryomorphaceae bacterium]